jgi:hypothetical protein
MFFPGASLPLINANLTNSWVKAACSSNQSQTEPLIFWINPFFTCLPAPLSGGFSTEFMIIHLQIEKSRDCEADY